MGMHLRTIEVFPFPAVHRRSIYSELVAQLTFTTGNPKEAATYICLNQKIPCLAQ